MKSVETDIKTDTPRDLVMDILRIVSCIMVISLHVMAERIYDPWTEDRSVMIVFQCICQVAVPVFFMLSGAFMKDTGFKKTFRKIIKLFILFIVFKLFFALWDCYRANGFIAPYLLNWDYGILDPCTYKYHLWFIYEYITILILAPVINSAVKAKKRTDLYLAVLFILYGIIKPLMTPVIIAPNVDANIFGKLLEGISIDFAIAPGYYCLGKAVHNLVEENRSKLCSEKKNIKLAGIALILWAAAVVINSCITGGKFKETGQFDYYILDRANPLICISAILLFAAFSLISAGCREKREEKSHCVVKVLAPCTLMIYLIHPLFIDIITDLSGFTAGSFTPVLSVPLKALFVFLLSLCFSLIVGGITKLFGHTKTTRK